MTQDEKLQEAKRIIRLFIDGEPTSYVGDDDDAGECSYCHERSYDLCKVDCPMSVGRRFLGI